MKYNIQIDKEFEELLPQLSTEDFNILEQSLIKNGFNTQFGRIFLWVPDEEDISNDRNVAYIIDGHNRYKICNKNHIDLPYWCYEFLHFKSKQEVIKWMYENQLARRNLSQVEKYLIVERYSKFLDDMARKNQSDGGKGLSNLTKVNVRKEKAARVGISEGSYYKLDKVMKSDNKEIKEKLKHKEISIDKAYQKIKKNEKDTPLEQIEKIDKRVKEIDKEIADLMSEKDELMNKRIIVFKLLDA